MTPSNPVRFGSIFTSMASPASWTPSFTSTTPSIPAINFATFFASGSRIDASAAKSLTSIDCGATVGDFLDKPVADGGLAFSRPTASAVLAAFILIAILVLPQQPGRHPGAQAGSPAT